MHSLARTVAARKHKVGTCMKGSMFVNKRHAALLDNCACMYSDLLYVTDFTYMRYAPTFCELKY